MRGYVAPAVMQDLTLRQAADPFSHPLLDRLVSDSKAMRISVATGQWGRMTWTAELE